MDNRDDNGSVIAKNDPGVINKAAQLMQHEITDADLAAIHKHTLKQFTKEQLFTFKAVLCDNEVDRQYERFTLKALQDLQKLFAGRTVIKDHRRSMDNQVARIYSTELVQDTKTIKAGTEPYTQLVAHCYMLRTASNADLIAEIEAGIKKEGSIGCSVAHAYCSICGTDNNKSYCPHWPGRKYVKEGNQEVECIFTLDGARDAYEYSLVPVPAQRAAGVSKSYTGTTAYEADTAPESTGGTDTPDSAKKAAETAVRMRMAALKIRQNTQD